MQKKQDADTLAEERWTALQQTQSDLEHTKAELRLATQTLDAVRNDVEELEEAVASNAVRYESTQAELQKTSWLLADAKNKLSEKEKHMDYLQSQVKDLRQQNVTLEKKLEAEIEARKEDAQEAQRSLDATRVLLETKGRKDLDELQANMTRLLDDERKAYRKKDEETAQRLQQLNAEWETKYSKLDDQFTTTLQNTRQEHQNRMDALQKEKEEQLEKMEKEYSDKEDRLVRKGKQLLEEAKAKAKEELERLDDEARELDERCSILEKEKKNLEEFHRTKIAALQQKLTFSSSQISDATRENDELLEKIQALEREKFKLSEENEQYRRQLGGRYGADGKFQSQLERLQKEYSLVVEENRRLKKQNRYGTGNNNDASLGVIAEGGDENNEGSSYSRVGAVDRRALTQLRQEYEERIEALNDEKRDLVMKNSAATTDVHKAEKRVWEREQEISRLEDENTSLRLQLSRMELSYSTNIDQQQGQCESPKKTIHDSPGSYRTTSPGIDRAKKIKAEQEERLRNQFSLISGKQGTPPRQPRTSLSLDTTASSSGGPPKKKVLSPSNKQQQTDLSKGVTATTSQQLGQDTLSSKMASDVFKIGASPSQSVIPKQNLSIMDFTKVDDSGTDEQPECTQS
jgi:chromosome segregation ATPase